MGLSSQVSCVSYYRRDQVYNKYFSYCCTGGTCCCARTTSRSFLRLSSPLCSSVCSRARDVWLEWCLRCLIGSKKKVCIMHVHAWTGRWGAPIFPLLLCLLEEYSGCTCQKQRKQDQVLCISVYEYCTGNMYDVQQH